MDVDEGLENRIHKLSSSECFIKDILDSIKTKRYAYTRLQRILIHLLLNLDENIFHTFHKNDTLYARVLGANKNGLEILSSAKNKSKIPIITKFANHKKIKSDSIKNMLAIDKKATDIYYMGLLNNKNNIKSNLDYYISPYIKK